MEEEVVIYHAEVYTKFYVHYDNTGTILSISNVKDTKLLSIETEFSEIEDFLTGKKHTARYKIAFFENITGPQLQEQEQLIKSNELVYVIPKTSSYNNEVTLVHDSIEKKWKLICKDTIPKKDFTFYITKLHNPHFLLKTISINDQLDFTQDFEYNIDSISVATAKEHHSYGIKEIK
jgi:hypothetical protein